MWSVSTHGARACSRRYSHHDTWGKKRAVRTRHWVIAVKSPSLVTCCWQPSPIFLQVPQPSQVPPPVGDKHSKLDAKVSFIVKPYQAPLYSYGAPHSLPPCSLQATEILYDVIILIVIILSIILKYCFIFQIHFPSSSADFSCHLGVPIKFCHLISSDPVLC